MSNLFRTLDPSVPIIHKLVKFTHKFVKKIEDNLNNFNYNVIVANLHEMYSFLNKEIDNEYKKNTLKVYIEFFILIFLYSNFYIELFYIFYIEFFILNCLY